MTATLFINPLIGDYMSREEEKKEKECRKCVCEERT
jgi:hypothetical protein